MYYRLLIFIVVFLLGCNTTYHITKGDIEYKNNQFAKAVKHYKKGYNKTDDFSSDSIKIELISKIAKTLYKINNNVEALTWSKKLSKLEAKLNKSKGIKKVKSLEEAKNYIKLGNIETALDIINSKLEKNKNNENAIHLKTICDCNYEWVANPTRYAVKMIDDFNSQYHETKAVFYGKDTNKVILCSSRPFGVGCYVKDHLISDKTGMGNINILVVEKNKNFKKKSKKKYDDDYFEWNEPIEIEDELNTEYDESAVSVAYKSNRIYYSTNFPHQKMFYGSYIYSFNLVAEKDLEGNKYYSNRGLKRESILENKYSVEQPSISDDELTMYFVSDMPGGYGGKDIWKVTRRYKSWKWGKPENLGKDINTSGNEVYPYIKNKNELYFSSDTHYGMGGLDIFKATKKKDGWKIENVKSPINSFSDDYGISFKRGKEEGMFTSARFDGTNGIYEFEYVKKIFRLIVFVKNQFDDFEIPEANIKLIASDGVEREFKTDKVGNVGIKLRENIDYSVLVYKKDFLNKKIQFSTKNISDSKNFVENVFLSPVKKTIDLPNIFYDVASWNLKDESKVALDGLVATLNDNPEISIELMSHSDMVGNDQNNLELSQKRAQSVVEYLVTKGVDSLRLIPVGYGEKVPKIVDRKVRKNFPEFKNGDVLNEAFINNLNDSDLKDKANQINRRTEFKVISTNFSNLNK